MIEDQDTEFKEDFTPKLLKSIVAFSNCNGGTIILGINDDGEEVGLKDPDDTAKKCSNAITDAIRPDVSLTTKIVLEEKNGKAFLRIKVSPGDKKPYYIREKGLRAEGVYIRKGASSVPVSEETFQSMIRNIRSVAYEEQISFNQDLTFDYTRSVFERKNVQFDEEHMKILHMIDDDRYTNLAFILSDQFNQSIKVASFSDEFRTKFLDRAELNGSILKQLDDTLIFVKRHNTLSSEIKGEYRVDTQAWSEESIREALVNALAHRDYSMNSPILVSIYPRKITITSPGGMPTPFSLEEMLRGVSSLRNKNLADVMYRLELIEAYGTGIPRIYGTYAASSVIPTIESGLSSFTITLPSIITGENAGLQRFLDENREFTRVQMQDALGMKKSEAVSTIGRLIEENTLIKMGEGRSVKYRVNRPL